MNTQSHLGIHKTQSKDFKHDYSLHSLASCSQDSQLEALGQLKM